MKIDLCFILIIIILLLFSSQNKASCRKSKNNKINEKFDDHQKMRMYSDRMWEDKNSVNCLRNYLIDKDKNKIEDAYDNLCKKKIGRKSSLNACENCILKNCGLRKNELYIKCGEKCISDLPSNWREKLTKVYDVATSGPRVRRTKSNFNLNEHCCFEKCLFKNDASNSYPLDTLSKIAGDEKIPKKKNFEIHCANNCLDTANWWQGQKFRYGAPLFKNKTPHMFSKVIEMIKMKK
jgi:hypothetical protein